MWETFNNKLMLLVCAISLCLQVHSQSVYTIDFFNDLYRVDVNTCNKSLVTAANVNTFFGALGDISFHPNGNLYVIATQGFLVQYDTITGIQTLVEQLPYQGLYSANNEFYNGLTVDTSGTFYITGVHGDLYTYSLGAGNAVLLGNIGYESSGDLTFYEGELILATISRQIISVDKNNPANSTVMFNNAPAPFPSPFDTPKTFAGLTTIVSECGEQETYAITNNYPTSHKINWGANNASPPLCNVMPETTPLRGTAHPLEYLASIATQVVADPLGQDTIFCEGQSITLDPGNAGADFLWQDGSAGQTFVANQTGTYWVQVTAGECITSDTIEVSIAPLPDATFTVLVDTICTGGEANFIRLDPSIGTDCLWTFSDGSTSTNCGIVSQPFYQSGYTSVDLTVTSNLGCTSSFTVDSAFFVLPSPQSAFSFNEQDGTVFSPGVQFTNESEFATSFEWDFAQLSLSNEVNPYYTFPSGIPNDYLTCLTAFSDNGCSDETCEFITIDLDLQVNIPNAFTPNNDNINDYFGPVFNDIQLEEYNLLIFDRWGEMVFESKDPNLSWDGTIKGSLVQDGVYVWKMEVASERNAERKTLMGHVTVIR